MNQSERFRVNAPNVVHETIDGEVVIVHLKKGDYYSLVKVGANIWENLTKGLARGEIIAEMFKNYDGNQEVIEEAVNDFIGKLEDEEIILVDESNGFKTSSVVTETDNNVEKLSFEVPTLDKYTDMEELLALDPIHDVEEAGWPKAKV
jgi:hypothetical protein